MPVLVKGALRVPRQKMLGAPLSGIRRADALGVKPRVPLPWSPVLVQLLSSEDGRLQHLDRLESVSGVMKGVSHPAVHNAGYGRGSASTPMSRRYASMALVGSQGCRPSIGSGIHGGA